MMWQSGPAPDDESWRRIERKVLDEVSMPVGTLLGAALTTSGVLLAAGLYWLREFDGLRLPHDVRWFPMVVLMLFLVTGAVSLIALVRRRFRWCCAAAYLSGLTAALGVTVLWWTRTAAASDLVFPSMLGALSALGMVVGWLGLALTPINRSQPDMRRAEEPLTFSA